MDKGTTATASGGYDNNFKTDTEKYNCPVCLLVLRDAMQTSCGHRFCQSCIHRVIGKSTMLKCPVDKQFSKPNQIFPDVAVRREVLSLEIQCSHQGCPWLGELRSYENHNENCQKKEIACPFGCTTRIVRCDVDTHLQTCPSRHVPCEYCGEKIQYQKREAHESECLKIPVSCVRCGEEGILRQDLGKHDDAITGTCPEVVVKCSYNSVGCTFTCKRTSMDQHVKDSMSEHLTMMSQAMVDQITKTREMGDVVTRLNEQIGTLYKTIRKKDEKVDLLNKELLWRNTTGQFHWKIDLRGRSDYHSTPFYSGCPGYKVQVDFDTESLREGSTRFSGFGLTLLRGDFDEQLMWPFNATVYITILDQKNSANPRNFACNVVVREVPRNRNDNRIDRLFKRECANIIKKEEIMGPGSRFVKNGSIFVEVSVVHCVFNCPDASSSPMASLTPVSIQALQPRNNAPPRSPPVISLASLALLQ